MLDTADSIRLLANRTSAGPTLVMCSPAGTLTHTMGVDSTITLGRDASCELSVADPTLSRFHARIVRRANLLTIEDLGSRNGVWLRGERIARAALTSEACVLLGDVVLTVVQPGVTRPSSTQRAAREGNVEPVYLGHAMAEIWKVLRRAACTELPVLVLGETGTGKELAAQELHRVSPRCNGPLRSLNCAAIPAQLVESTLFGHERGAFTGADRARAGVFEEAAGGTVFLDEIGELSSMAQASLLRVLETQRVSRVGASRELAVDVRIVAATHRDLEAMVARGEFRLDLLHRLRVIVVKLPPLRARRDEIPFLARHFLTSAQVDTRFDPRALARLINYDWPGNIRELRNVVARAAAFCEGDCIVEGDLPEELRSPARREPAAADVESPLRARIKSVERAELLKALAAVDGNQRQAAALLGLPLRTLERRLRTLRDQAL